MISEVNKEHDLRKKVIPCLIVIGIIGLLLRLHYLPFEIPIVLDALTYFNYANDISITGKLPVEYNFPNNGWPLFLSMFFSLFTTSDFLEMMNLQRIITSMISVSTIIPVYLLCTRFFRKEYAIFGASLFIFEPRIIQNSLQGTTEPLFIFFGTSAMFLFFSNKTKWIYWSFALIALFSIIRYEGLLMIIPFSIMYLIRLKKNKESIFKYILAITIFVLILLPFAYLRTETIGQDGLVSHVSAGVIATDYLVNDPNNGIGFSFFTNGLMNLVKFLGWALIPFFITLVPFGIYQLFKKRNYEKHTIIFISIIATIPALYAYARDIQDTRYLYVIFPIFSLISLYTIEKISKEFNLTKIIICISIVIIASVVFLELKKIDYEHEMEAYEIARIVYTNTFVTNDFYPETAYLRVIEFEKEFPIEVKGRNLGPKILPTQGFSTIEEFIDANRYLELDHLVVDNRDNRPEYLKNVFHNEDKYPFLIKKYDSSEYGFEYHVKIFEIDYGKLGD